MMDSKKIYELVEEVTKAVDALADGLKVYDAESEKNRANAQTAADAYMTDLHARKTLIADQIAALDKKKEDIQELRRIVSKQLAQATVIGGAEAVTKIQKQLAELNNDEATLEQMKASLKTVKIPDDDDLYSKAESSQRELDDVNDERGKVFAEVYPLLEATVSQLEEVTEHAVRYANNNGGRRLENHTFNRVREYHAAPDKVAESAPQPASDKPYNLERHRYIVEPMDPIGSDKKSKNLGPA